MNTAEQLLRGAVHSWEAPLVSDLIEGSRGQYADAFSETVDAETFRMTLPASVSVLADPASPWWKSNEVHSPDDQAIESTPGASYTWHRAHDVSPLPNVDVRAQSTELP